MHLADTLAFDKTVVSQPVWNCFNTAADAVDLPSNILLHAGPSFPEVSRITKPILNSACVASVYEGLARDFNQAEAMILCEEIQLRSAQDYGVVTPLAAVVSGSMPLHSVYDAWLGKKRVFAPINGGSRPSLRLGLRSKAVLDHIRWLNTRFVDFLQKGLGEGISLIPLAVKGLKAGDDCHGRTHESTKALVGELKERANLSSINANILEFLATSPSLFLNLWMAATKCMMKAAEGIVESSFVTGVGGNGFEVGIQVSGCPGKWFKTEATSPVGAFDIEISSSRALGAIGDSAVIEGFGLGAMAIELSPIQKKGLGKFLPLDIKSRIESLSVGRHPYFQRLNIRLGSTARKAVELRSGPVIGLGILDNQGLMGRLGAGIYEMPVSPFEKALQALKNK